MLNSQRGVTERAPNKSSIARKHSLKSSQVAYSDDKGILSSLAGAAAIYHKPSEKVWLIPDLPNERMVSFNPPILKTNSREIDLTQFNIDRGNFHQQPQYDFSIGFNLVNGLETVVFEGVEYRWAGGFPKAVPPNSTIENSGGVSFSGWVGKFFPLQDRQSFDLTLSSFGIFGGSGKAASDDIARAMQELKSVGQPLRFVTGQYLIDKDLTIDIPCVIPFGAVLKAINGAVITIADDFEAGLHRVFDSSDDFHASPKANPSVKFTKHAVKTEWFGAKTAEKVLKIKTVPDSSLAILKAHRAATGDYKLKDKGPDYWSEYSSSYVSLSPGLYRCDKPVQFGTWTREGEIVSRYKSDGGGMQGDGRGLSLLVFTDDTYRGNAHFTASYMSGEMHKYNDFKAVFCNPSLQGNDRYYSYAGAMMLFTSIDSLETNNLWAAGSYYSYVDANGVVRGGVGIQFESVTNHSFNGLLTEHCVHGVAFSSWKGKGSNIEGFFNQFSDIAFGNFIPAWPDLHIQATENAGSIHGFESKACYALPIYFGTKENRIDITGISINGFGEASTTRTTTRAFGFSPSGGAYGRMAGKINGVNYGLFTDNGTALAGKVGAKLSLDFTVKDAPAAIGTESAIANIQNPLSNVDLILSLEGTTRLPAVRNFSPHTKLSLSLKDVKNPGGAIAFINHGNGNLLIDSLSEEGGEGQWLGFSDGGTVVMPAIYVASNRNIRKGAGSSAVISQVSVQAYANVV